VKDQSKTKRTQFKKKVSIDESGEYAENIINTVREPLIILDQDLRVVTASRSFYDFFKVNPDETEGQLIYNLGNDQWDIPKLRELLETILPQKTTFDNFEVEHEFAGIGRRTMLLNARQIKRALGKERIILLAIEDITERKQLERLLIDSEEQYRRLFETASDGIVLLEKSEGKITQANPATEKLLGYTEKQSIGKKLQEIGVVLDTSDFQTTMHNLNKSGILNYKNVKVKTSSGQHIETEIYLVDRAKLVQCNIRDITEHKRAEEELNKTEELYRLVVDNIADVITVMDMNLRFTYVSPSIQRLRGYTAEEAVAQTIEQVMTPESLQIVAQVFEEELKLEASGTADPGRSRILELEEYRKDGSIVHMENQLSFLRDEAQKPVGIISLTRDIAERMMAEKKLKQTNIFLDSIIENIPNMIFLKDARDLRFIQFNRAGEDLLGYSREELLGKSDYDFFPKEQADHFTKKDRDVLNGKEVVDIPEESLQTRTKGERTIHTKKLPLLDAKGEPEFLLGISEDITERKKMEETLRERDIRLKKLTSWVPGMMYQFTKRPDGTFCVPFTTKAVRDIFGCSPEDIREDFFPIARVILPEDLGKVFGTIEYSAKHLTIWTCEYRVQIPGQSIKWVLGKSTPEKMADGSITWHGFNTDITETKKAEETLRKSEEEFRSLAESMPQIVWVTRKDGWNIYSNQQWVDYTGLTLEESYGHGWDTPFHPDDKQKAWDAWQNATKNNDIYSIESRLRRADGVYHWWLIRGVPLLDKTGEIIKWFGTCTDIDNIKIAEKQLLDTLKNLRKAFGAIVQVTVSAIESRDPYTAGHQLRVADLARTIATEMGLSHQKIEGIRMAGAIHDIGKLSIPSEILSKPSKLTDLEFSLIKEHSQTGYDILKDVESPWPLAQIVYQHHERMDGSGYPRNLKGDEILMEARIMAVSDVVESMASHRPYRAAIGIEAALEEIEKNKGMLYDDAVVDACLRLFREKGFQLQMA
jgi:PAS domain S-box-containing protein